MNKASSKLVRRINSVSNRTILEAVQQALASMGLTRMKPVITPGGGEFYPRKEIIRYQYALRSEFRKKTCFRDKRILRAVCRRADLLGLLNVIHIPLRSRIPMIYDVTDAGRHNLMTRVTCGKARDILSEIEEEMAGQA